MRVWRLAVQGYEALDGEGARLFGGRWNEAGLPMVYTSTHLSLAVLEQLAHGAAAALSSRYVALQIEVPTDAPATVLPRSQLGSGWRSEPRICRNLGNDWLRDGGFLALDVPSVLVPQESNVLLNPRHPAMMQVRVTAREDFIFDPRLIR